MTKRLVSSLLTVLLLFSFAHGEVRTKANSVTKAKEFIKAKMYDRAIPILNGLIEESPANSEYHFLLAQCFLKSNNVQAADNEFGRVVAIDSSKGRTIGEMFKEQGYLALGNKDYSAASFSLWKATSYNPELKKAIGSDMLKKGKKSFDGGNTSEANSLFSIAQRLDSQYNAEIASLFYSKAISIIKKDDFYSDKKTMVANDKYVADANSLLNRCLSFDSKFDFSSSNDVNVLFYVATYYKQNNIFDKARPLYAKLLQIVKDPEKEKLVKHHLHNIERAEKSQQAYNSIKFIRDFNENQNTVYALAFSHKGDILASAGYGTKIALIDLKKNQLMALIKAYDNNVNVVMEILFDSADRFFYTSGDDAPVSKWSVEKRELESNLAMEKDAFRMCMSRSSKYIYAGYRNGSLVKYDLENDKVVWKAESVHSKPIDGIDISYNDEVLISADRSGKVLLTDASSGKTIGSLVGHSDMVRFVRAHPSKPIVATGDTTGILRLWDLESRNVISKITHHGSVRGIDFHPDKPIIFSGDENGFVYISNYTTGKVIKEIKADNKYVYWVSISPDRKILATSGSKEDKSVKFWNIDIDWDVLLD